MGLTEHIKELCELKGISISALEKELNLGNSTIRRWSNNSPSVDKVKLVADYFNVSLDSLIGDQELSAKDEKSIQKDLSQMMYDLETNSNSPLCYGHDIDDEDRELLKIALEGALRMLKRENKAKYTPKKYRS